VFAIHAAGLEDEVAFLSDGQLSGLCNKGMTVGEVSPESAVGGPLALVENGDRILIDIVAHTIDVDVRSRSSTPVVRAAATCRSPAPPGTCRSISGAFSRCRPAWCSSSRRRGGRLWALGFGRSALRFTAFGSLAVLARNV
jgi:dihydroxyacid dehydratase/phosphogluconate dehydratase